jgi:hypothetical protein
MRQWPEPVLVPACFLLVYRAWVDRGADEWIPVHRDWVSGKIVLSRNKPSAVDFELHGRNTKTGSVLGDGLILSGWKVLSERFSRPPCRNASLRAGRTPACAVSLARAFLAE